MAKKNRKQQRGRGRGDDSDSDEGLDPVAAARAAELAALAAPSGQKKPQSKAKGRRGRAAARQAAADDDDDSDADRDDKAQESDAEEDEASGSGSGSDDADADPLVGVPLSDFFSQSLSKGQENKVREFARNALAAAIANEPGSEDARFNELAAQSKMNAKTVRSYMAPNAKKFNYQFFKAVLNKLKTWAVLEPKEEEEEEVEEEEEEEEGEEEEEEKDDAEAEEEKDDAEAEEDKDEEEEEEVKEEEEKEEVKEEVKEEKEDVKEAKKDDEDNDDDDDDEEKEEAAPAPAAAAAAKKGPPKKLTAKEKKRQKALEKRAAEKAAAAEKLKTDEQRAAEKKQTVEDALIKAADDILEEDDDSEQEWSHEVDIKIEDFSISVPGRTLLRDTNLTLAYGVRYGLAGPNGCGKSTLLGYIKRREGAFRAIPKRLVILHVEQEVVGDDTPAIESVMESDPELVTLLREKTRLEADEDADGERLGMVYDRLAAIGADQAKARASAILAGLQFADADFEKKTREFSGGWRMRLSLARALFMRPDILLLDEPTNHLDLYAVIWLEQYLSTWKKTLLVVSHDRDFLNNVVNQTISIYNEQLYQYKGDYDSYDVAHKQMISSKRKQLDKQQKELARLKKQVSQQQQKASAAKGKQAKANKKDRGGNQGKQKKTQAGNASSKEAIIAKIEAMGKVEELPHDYEVEFDFPPVDELTVPVIQVKNASFGYANGPTLFHDVDGGIDLDSKIALIGANGSGKTTLMNVLMGVLEPQKGEVVINRKLRVGLFRQHFVDQIPMNETPVGYLSRVTKERGADDLTEGDIRKFLGRFGLKGKTQILQISQLSGGQKSRLVFTDIALRYPHILFLDEPTNHLDIESVDALNEALQAWEGGIVLVTHDGRLINDVASNIWIMNHEDRRIDHWDGTFAEYRQKLIDEKFAADFFEDQENEADIRVKEARAKALERKAKAKAVAAEARENRK